MKLGDRQIAALKPQEKRYMVCTDDGLALYVEVMTSGAKYWRMRCRQGKKETKLTLGEYPVVTLAEARNMCTDIKRGMVHNGVSPREVLNPPKAATFKDLAEHWKSRCINNLESMLSRLLK